ncbi:hypothetical protein SD70_03415 [Gordoniibacillus kamchatkensis]|uniref:Uncharacterized protein n=1 Tax=Gordoniibacillus kamchatkensis TaxID=1590651 RepID=A0ABR5ALM7_9BACL|nr:hypothetical protein SD70_03415 [Paenibacillus sp. VKM B-2647]
MIVGTYRLTSLHRTRLPDFFYKASLEKIINFILFILGQQVSHFGDKRSIWGRDSIRGIRNDVIHKHLMSLYGVINNMPHGIWEWTRSFAISNYYDKRRMYDFNYRFFPYDISYFINNNGVIDIENIERLIYKVLIEGDNFNPAINY